MFAPVYLDYNATAPLAPAVLEAMLPWLGQRYGNASSRHEYGRDARRAVDEARARVAAAVGAHPTEVVFTSGGSEANNLFLRGAAAALAPAQTAGVRPCLAVSAVEHPCVREPARALARRGWDLLELPVDENGLVPLTEFRDAMGRKPRIVSVMLANNETGVIQGLAALADAARAARPWFHTDAVQAVGRIPVDFRALNQAGVHAVTLSAHKIGGPMGAGALVSDKRVDLEPLIYGGGQERGLRSGTENVPAIVGFGVACELAVSRRDSEASRLLRLRRRLEDGLAAVGAVVFGRGAERLPNTVYFSLPDLDGETLVGRLDREGFAVASGAACASAKPEPSHVLMAMGIAPGIARGAVRVSLGGDSSETDVVAFLGALSRTVDQLKNLSVVATMA
ncbi:MAG: cysteine desulfurase [Rhodocyclaceae bacterium]|nr:cysteine desulfurase [Rhodocyclaceae bacterium]